MRKGMAVMLSAALAGCLWGCNGEGENAEEVSLYAQGMDVIRLMQEMSQSEEYAGFISGSPELQDKIVPNSRTRFWRWGRETMPLQKRCTRYSRTAIRFSPQPVSAARRNCLRSCGYF